jgi:hypothetical protein
MSNEGVNSYFSNDEKKIKAFRRHLKKEFYGVFVYENKRWAAYGWMSRPSTRGPTHLPTSIQRLDAHWIFYCRTAEAFQGRGLYKSVLKLLVKQALDERRDAELIPKSIT